MISTFNWFDNEITNDGISMWTATIAVTGIVLFTIWLLIKVDTVFKHDK